MAASGGGPLTPADRDDPSVVAKPAPTTVSAAVDVVGAPSAAVAAAHKTHPVDIEDAVPASVGGGAPGASAATGAPVGGAASPTVGGLPPAVVALHAEACAAGELSYIDPATGYTVFTEAYHRKRGRCCGSGCRHCPFGHIAVPKGKKKGSAK